MFSMLFLYQNVLQQHYPPVVATTTTLQNLACTNFRASPEEFHLMIAHNQVHSMRSCKSLHSPYLFIASKSLHADVQVMLATMFWLYSKSLLCMCLLCSPWKHLSHSHTESHSLLRKLHLDYEQSITSVTLVACTISQSCWTCVSRWFGRLIINSCECVFLWSPMHLSIVHTLSHFLLRLWRPDSSLTVNQNNAEAPSYFF